MSLDWADVSARARDGVAFSNSTEYEMWSVNWCDRCLREAPFRNMGRGSGCPILGVAVLEQKTPAEWLEQPSDRYPQDAFHCIEFKGPGGGGGEPRPRPDPRGMEGLFPRPARAARMFVQPDPAVELVPVDAALVDVLDAWSVDVHDEALPPMPRIRALLDQLEAVA